MKYNDYLLTASCQAPPKGWKKRIKQKKKRKKIFLYIYSTFVIFLYKLCAKIALCKLSFFFLLTAHRHNVKSQVTQADLHRFFYVLGAGQLEEVRVQRDKGFGFVRYNNHSEAALAIQMGNAKILCGKPIKVTFMPVYQKMVFLV